MADFTVRNEGSVFVFTAETEAAQDLLDYGELGDSLEEWQFLGPYTFAIDHRPAQQLVEQLESEGYSVE